MQRFFLLVACAALFLVGCGDGTKKDGDNKDNKAKTSEKADDKADDKK